MGRAMSKSFCGFGTLMQTSAFKDGLGGLLRNGVQFVNIVLPAFALAQRRRVRDRAFLMRGETFPCLLQAGLALFRS